MGDETRDLAIVGGGPTGLFAAFYAGMRGMSTRILDSLPELGGQLTALYPEKYIYDVPGFPEVRAAELVRRLVEQAMRFGPEVVLDEEVVDVAPDGDGFLLRGRRGTYRSRAVLVAGGKGAFEPRRLECPGYAEFLGRGVHYAVRDAAALEGKRILVVGGGDSAVDWALTLKDRARELTLIHRRETFRAHEHGVARLLEAREAGEITVLPHHEVRRIEGTDGGIRSATIFDNRTGEERTLPVDVVLALLGFRPELGPIARWGLRLRDHRIVVGPTMETNVPGIFAAGDVVTYEGKLDLLATGFGEAAIAVNHALHRIDPDARVTPGHSTHLKVFRRR